MCGIDENNGTENRVNKLYLSSRFLAAVVCLSIMFKLQDFVSRVLGGKGGGGGREVVSYTG